MITQAAHPRVGGENAEIILDVLGDDGSSPRRRGKHPIDNYVVERRVAHPRVGGENDLAVNGNFDGNGSSPRRRGKRPHLHE